MMKYQQKKSDEFVTDGGIRERMTAARLGYRTSQRETIEQLSLEVERLQRENNQLKRQTPQSWVLSSWFLSSVRFCCSSLAWMGMLVLEQWVYMLGFITSWHFTVYCLERLYGAVTRMSSTLAPKPMVYLPGAVVITSNCKKSFYCKSFYKYTKGSWKTNKFLSLFCKCSKKWYKWIYLVALLHYLGLWLGLCFNMQIDFVVGPYFSWKNAQCIQLDCMEHLIVMQIKRLVF